MRSEGVRMRVSMGRKKRLVIILLLLFVAVSGYSEAYAEAPYKSYNYTIWEQSVPSPDGYLPARAYSGEKLGVGKLKAPQDMFAGDDGRLYLLDSGNNRIVILDSQMKPVRIIDTLHSDQGSDRLNEPQGIFVGSDGTIYVADKGNQRVILMDGDGTIRKLITRPDSDLLDKDFVFQPEKVLVDRSGSIYVLAFGVYGGALAFDGNGGFNGFYGSNTVEASLKVKANILWKRIFTKEQKESMERSVPIEYTNFDIKNDFIFTCTKKNETSTDEIKKLNLGGENVLRYSRRTAKGGLIEHKNFGDFEYAELKGVKADNAFADIDVDSEGFINVLDGERGRVFQYDQESNLLLVFGGMGDQVGTFKHPVAVESANGRILVLDSAKNSITEFSPTSFGEWVRKAVRLYNDGLYEAAIEPWFEVLKRNSNYELAYAGIGKALLKQEKYGEAMKYFKLGYDREGYSKAFKEYRTDFVRKHFTAFVMAVLLLFLVPWLISKRGKIIGIWKTFSGRTVD